MRYLPCDLETRSDVQGLTRKSDRKMQWGHTLGSPLNGYVGGYIPRIRISLLVLAIVEKVGRRNLERAISSLVSRKM